MQQGPKQETLSEPLGQNALTRTPGQPRFPVQPSTRRSRLGATFFASEDGAVTVDWVVLTAAVVGLGFAVIIPIGYSTESSVVELQSTIMAVETGYPTTAP
jgi:hypothetical protein